MAVRVPRGELDRRYSSDGATPTSWARARKELERAKSYWLSTVRPNARPHVTTIAAVWLDGAVHFTTGARERKARNLARNPYCIVTTGYRGLTGLDLVMEGKATSVTTTPALRGLAAAYREKYGKLFRYEVRGQDLYHQGTADRVLAFRLRATKALGFGKGRKFSQTRWRL
jgi:hypothetical protein